MNASLGCIEAYVTNPVVLSATAHAFAKSAMSRTFRVDRPASARRRGLVVAGSSTVACGLDSRQLSASAVSR